jgi:Bifunctional DNA primase/polymerase, N-terminal
VRAAFLSRLQANPTRCGGNIMTNATALRHELRTAGYSPIPLHGKVPPEFGKRGARKGLSGWQTLFDVSAEMIDSWSQHWPDAENTGCLTRLMPTLDVDILDAAAAKAIADFVREYYEDAGHVLMRIGKEPKFAIPFRCNADESFKKISIPLIAPDGSEGQKLEFLADGQQVVVAGIHPETKRLYRWLNGAPGQIKLEELPYIRESEARWLLEQLVELLIRDFGYKRAPTRTRTTNGAKPAPHEGGGGGDRDWGHLSDNILAGRDLHDSVRDLAAKLIASGMKPGAAINFLRGLMDASTAPKDDRWHMRVSEIPAAVDSAVAKGWGKGKDKDPEPPPRSSPPPEAEPAPTRPDPRKPIEKTIKVFRTWLLLTDPTPVYAVLGTVAANLLPGEPCWCGLVGPPSSAKTEILNSVRGLPHVVEAGTITPSGLLSGTPKKQQDKGARGGLLRQIGAFGIMLLKDFGSVLSMHAETRAETMAALREVYDGSWTRHLGSAGGKSLSWKGKLALLFGVTEVIDSHHSVIGSMGDRFLLSRLKPVPGKKQFARALKHAGGGINQMRKELADAVVKLFARRREPTPISEEEAEAIGKVIALAVRLRGTVERDRRTREMEAIYGAEGTARIGLALERLLAGLDTLGMDRKEGIAVIKAVALDSVPPLRRRAYETVCHYRNVETGDVAIELRLPTNTARRILEDLAAHGLVTRISQGPGKPDLWDKSTWEEDEAAIEAEIESAA